MSDTLVPTEGVGPVSEVDRVLLRLYLGQGFVELHTPANHAKQMQNPALVEAKAAIERLIAEARRDEIYLFAQACTERLPGETWEDWAFRVTDYLKKRTYGLNQMKGKAV